MPSVIRLNGGPHKLTQELLPWFVNGTLDAEETAMIEAHLEGCAECRAECGSERALGTMIASVSVDVVPGWDALRERIKADGSVRCGGAGAVKALWRRPVPLAWAITAQAACLALVIGVALVAPIQRDPPYRALGSPTRSAAGNLVVIFKPTTSEQDLRGALRSSGARLVDGPTASDAYVLRVPDAGRLATLKRLRADTHVVLAEPIDGEARP